MMTQSYILQLETDSSLVTGHKEYFETLKKIIAHILENNSPLDLNSQECLLDEIDVVFTEEDNNELPNKEEILSVLQKSNLHGSPGTDGITNFLYYKLTNLLGDTYRDAMSIKAKSKR